jgi:ABC-2 type transport system permease protein
MSNISCLAVKTIAFNQIKIFFKEFQFNVIAPLINSLLFVFILSIITQHYVIIKYNSSYINFLIPGIIIMVVIQTSFNHLSERIISMKQIGSFNDFLSSPNSRIEIFFSFLLASICVCIVVSFINIITLGYSFGFFAVNYIKLFYYLFLTIVIFSSLGAITGFLSYTWDLQSSIINFFILPLSLLSGTFFSLESVNKEWHFLFIYNPIYQLVNGFRSSYILDYELNLENNILIIIFTLMIFILSTYIFKKGYRVII